MDGECEGASYKSVFDLVRCPRSGPGSNELLVGYVWQCSCDDFCVKMICRVRVTTFV